MRSAVVLPQPDGPEQDHQLAVLDLEATGPSDGGGRLRREALGDVVELDFGHATGPFVLRGHAR